MTKTITTRYDVAEHLRTPEEMAAYLEPKLSDSFSAPQFLMPHSAGCLLNRAKRALGVLNREGEGTHGVTFEKKRQD